ncbi:hypothetical protein, partial [Psychromonas antarctica]|uniref:hypothetical protein n=1 Tax=Psychromonas antarctica TaxID=67573 RepID=UPI001EE7E594
ELTLTQKNYIALTCTPVYGPCASPGGEEIMMKMAEGHSYSPEQLDTYHGVAIIGASVVGIRALGPLGALKNNITGAAFEGGLYRSVPKGRNPLEIHPIFNTEKAIHRYTGEGQGGLYLGSSQRIVNSEFTGNGASIDGLVNNKYNVKIDNLLDLTNPSVRSELGISLDDLVRTGPNKKWNYEITNPLGKFAEESGYNGIIAPAAQADGGVNLIIFKPELVK